MTRKPINTNVFSHKGAEQPCASNIASIGIYRCWVIPSPTLLLSVDAVQMENLLCSAHLLE